MHTTSTRSFVRLSPVETAIGWPLGSLPVPLPQNEGAPGRELLERVVLEALVAGPTFVTFSGGRDSSAVLALAAHVARREQLPLPVPVTTVHPGVPESDESAWQGLVIRHLGITERIVLTVTDEHRLLGERARASLRRRGLLWPAALHNDDVVLEQVAGGQLLTGEGGDEVLGRRRITPVYLLLHERHRPSRSLVKEAALALVPGAPRALVARVAAHRRRPEWLRGEAAQQLAHVEGVLTRSPWRWDDATVAMIKQRPYAVLAANYAAVAAEHSVHVRHPLRDPRFLLALAHDAGRWGYRGRTHLMRVLFHDLLPDELLARSSKAWFNGAHFGEDERAFARDWDGSGLDADLVDADALREHWLSGHPSGSTAPLLHQAWLATSGAAS
jgi:asparagine synthetase B (glutamine-hydrolysing)